MSLVSLAFAASAAAQPGSQGPGLEGSEYHAVAPLPRVMPSPMPSLPPPIALAPNEAPTTPFPNSDRPFAIVHRGFIANVERDGRIRFGDRKGAGGLLVDPIYGPIAHASFDLTDLLFGWIDQDPYLTAKLDVMEKTRPARERRKANYDQIIMDRALADLPIYLQAVWTNGEWTSAQRRQVLFELWDEAAEDGNELVRDGGIRARVIISHFIATRLPTGTTYAFTAAELARMNGERSAAAAFDPYGEDSRDLERIAAADGDDADGFDSGILYASLAMARAL